MLLGEDLGERILIKLSKFYRKATWVLEKDENV
jgi:hypothetical protein